jgi:malonyl-CoA/methylmalonyl-CoA synthetase
MLPLIEQTLKDRDRANRPAVLTLDGRYSYQHLLDASARVARSLVAESRDLEEARVAFLIPPGFDYVAAQWGIWRAGGLAVPLCPQHPAPELAHVLDDSNASIVIAHPDYEAILRPLAAERKLRFLLTTELRQADAGKLPDVDAGRRAMMLYTSGTTGKPKGVVTTHEIIAAQISSLVEAWEWSGSDHVLNVLPLHHIHGIINVLGCALWSGATWETLRKFDADAVWRRIGDGELTLFMAVPTVYSRLIALYDASSPDEQQQMKAGCQKLRLMVCGSAALPVSMLEKWRAISGHTLLERYGMTEIGMGLSNPFRGERSPGCVGKPLPGVQARLSDENGVVETESTPGEIQINGPTVFKEYWRKPEATAEAFTADGWFKTGDVAVRENGVHRIFGRESVDIIKTGGYKVSALEIEETLRLHPAISECAVVGVPDEEWGQRVGAAVVLKPDQTLDLNTLRDWSKERLAIYKVPSLLRIVNELPRNAMGKVTKPAVVELFQK